MSRDEEILAELKAAPDPWPVVTEEMVLAGLETVDLCDGHVVSDRPLVPIPSDPKVFLADIYLAMRALEPEPEVSEAEVEAVEEIMGPVFPKGRGWVITALKRAREVRIERKGR